MSLFIMRLCGSMCTVVVI